MPILQMKCSYKRLRTAKLVGAAMFVLGLVVLAFLATSSCQSGIPRYIQDPWIFPDENLPYDDPDRQFLALEESVWFNGSPEGVELVPVTNPNLLTTPEPYVKEQDVEIEESSGWKIALVAAVLLVSLVGSLSMVYYLCVWRGGRIHYQPQKEVYA